MSNMKCPSCGQELKQDYYDCEMLECHNPKCKHYYDSCVGREELWQELIRTRKALDVAVDALGYYASENSWDETNRWMFVENGFEFAKDVLEQITALTKGGDNE